MAHKAHSNRGIKGMDILNEKSRIEERSSQRNITNPSLGASEAYLEPDSVASLINRGNE